MATTVHPGRVNFRLYPGATFTEVTSLLDAAKMTAEILIAERERAGEEADDDLNQVVGAIGRFLEGWAG